MVYHPDDENTYWWTTEDNVDWKNDGENTYFFIVSATDLDTNFDGKVDLRAIRVPNKYAVVSDKRILEDLIFHLTTYRPAIKPILRL